MHVAIVGSREFPDLPRVEAYVALIAAKHPDAVIVSGGARGVDRTAEAAAFQNGLGVISYRPYEYENMTHHKEFSIATITEPSISSKRRINPPYFSSYGQAAFHRNGWIVEDADVVVAFHSGSSRGTADSIRKARELGKPTFVYT